MVRNHLYAAVLVGLCSTSFPLAAIAQDASAAGTTRCGGLLCDLYYAGKPAPAPGQPEAPDPTRLPCRDFLCAAFGGRTHDQAPTPAEAIVAPADTKPVKAAKHKTKPHKAMATASAAGSDK